MGRDVILAWQDLRQFLSYLEKKGLLQRVSVPVDLDQEVGAICRRVMDANGPAIWFEQPGNSHIPVVVNILGTRERYAMALGVEPKDLHRQWIARTAKPMEPMLVDGRVAPCKQNILTGSAVDLGRFPVPVWNELDGGPYITFGGVISKDPLTGIRNVGMYRLQVHDRNHLGILAAPYTHLSLQRAKAPGTPFPVAIVIGADPMIHACASASVPFGMDEVSLAGALRQEPIAVTACETIPLEVPANAEIVIEGEILPGVTRMEGPFGEFTGYYGPALERTVIEVKAITFRDNPIFLATYEGKPPQESNVVTSIPREAEILRTVPIPGVKSVHVTNGGCGAFIAVVGIEKPFEGYGKMIGLSVLGTNPGRYIKVLIVVDDDIDVYNWTEVEWAVATRVQPHRDVEIITGVTGLILDPSLPREEKISGSSRTSKMIIDATGYDASSYESACLPSREAMEKVQREWSKYGLRI